MEKRKVLIVDDEPGVRESLRMVLKEQYDAVLATSGEEALEMLPQVQPDLVLLDVLMPGIDGLVVLERIKEQDQRVPVLMLAAGDDHIVSSKAIEAFSMRLKAGSQIVLRGSRHEIMQERDLIREQFWAAFDAYVTGAVMRRAG